MTGARGAGAPIGVFDSGVGGLTVVRALMHQLPHESVVYVGDTARVPYGPKSPQTVRRYSSEIAAYLMEQGVKAVVVACNTATAHALDVLQAELPVPVVGVVEPGARAAVAPGTPSGAPRRVGVIGTVGTIRSGAYERAIRALAPDAYVVARPCPLFVPLVEEGWLDHPATELVAREYLDPFQEHAVDTLVLGCTHYPLLRPLVARVVGPGVRLIDSAHETAAATARALAAASLAASPGRAPQHRFVVTDGPEQFARVAAHFLGAPLQHVETLALAC